MTDVLLALVQLVVAFGVGAAIGYGLSWAGVKRGQSVIVVAAIIIVWMALHVV